MLEIESLNWFKISRLDMINYATLIICMELLHCDI